jgi:uncharacterized repeat protein (TIGR02543 family)
MSGARGSSFYKRWGISMRAITKALASILLVAALIAAPIAFVLPSSDLADASPWAMVSYDPNYGLSGDHDMWLPQPSSLERGGGVEVKFDPLPFRDGYVFVGWNTAEDGSGKWYRVTDPYEDRFYTGDGDVVLYAQWTEIGTSYIDLRDIPADADIEITWSASENLYKMREVVDGASWVALPNGVVEIFAHETGGGGYIIWHGSVRFTATSDPFPEDKPLYVMLNSMNLFDDRVPEGYDDFDSLFDVRPGAKVVFQLYGENEITQFSLNRAAIRVPEGAEAVFTAQADASLRISRDVNIPLVHVTATFIGGNGASGAAQAEGAGHIQFESGYYEMHYYDRVAPSTSGAFIGGGGGGDIGNGGDGGVFEMHGGSLNLVQNTYAALYGAAIGGGGTFSANAGCGGTIFVTGGAIDIGQDVFSYENWGNGYGGIVGSALGGGGSAADFTGAHTGGRGGDSGAIDIRGGRINVVQTGYSISGAAIGSGGSVAYGGAPGNATGKSDKGENYISISGGEINVEQSSGSQTSAALRGAAIGGGSNNQVDIGGSADVRITGGAVYVDRISHSRGGDGRDTGIYGPAIGGGYGEQTASSVLIGGGNVTVVETLASNGWDSPLAPAFGNSSGHQDSKVTIYGGSISVKRSAPSHGLSIPIAPVGQNGDFGVAPIINGGSIILSGDKTFEISGANAPRDSQGNLLYRTNIPLPDPDRPVSLFVKKALYIDPEFGTPRYADFCVDSKNRDVTADPRYNELDFLSVYLPQGDVIHYISLEVSDNGSVKEFTSVSPNGATVSAAPRNEGADLHRVAYRIGGDLRYESDIVHIASGETFSQSLRAKAASLSDKVAPSSPAGILMQSTDAQGATSIVSLLEQTYYVPTETPLVTAPNASGTPSAPVATAYGNIRISDPYQNLQGRLIIAAAAVDRVDVTYVDSQTESAPRSLTRIAGEGYSVYVGYDKSSDPLTLYGGPVAKPPSVGGGDPIWTSQTREFIAWRLSGTEYQTGSIYNIPEGSPSLTFASQWTDDSTVTVTVRSDGPGYVQYRFNEIDAWQDLASPYQVRTVVVPAEGSVYLKANPDTGASFIWWTDALSGQTAQQELRVGTEDVSVTAQFVASSSTEKLNATITPYFPGALQFSQNGIWQDFPASYPEGSGTLTLPRGSSIDLKVASMPLSYLMDRWSGDLSGTEPQKTLTMNSVKNVTLHLIDVLSESAFVELIVSTSPFDSASLVTYTYEGRGESLTGTIGGESYQDTYVLMSLLKGGTLTLEASPIAGEAFRYWSGAISTAEPNASMTITGTVSITAHFGPAASTHSVGLSAAGGGDGEIRYSYRAGDHVVSGTVSSQGPVYIGVPHGTALSLDAVSSDGSEFLWWAPLGASSLPIGFPDRLDSHQALQINGDLNAAARFEDESKVTTLEVNIEGPGTIKFLTNSSVLGPDSMEFTSPHLVMKVPLSATFTMTATPNDDESVFIWWTGDLWGYHPKLSTTVISPGKSVTAHFADRSDAVEIYAEYVSTDGKIQFEQNGKLQDFPSSQTLTVFKNSSLPLQAVPVRDTIGFVWWTWDLSGQDPDQTLEIGEDDLTVGAIFGLKSDLTTLEAATTGTGAGKVQYQLLDGWHDFPSSGTLTVFKNSTMHLRAVPIGDDDMFVWWTEDLSGQDAEPALKIENGPKRVTAQFEPESRVATLAATVDGPGKIQFEQNGKLQDFPMAGSPLAGSLHVVKSSSLPLYAMADEGASLIAWSGALSGQTPLQTLSIGESDLSVGALFGEGEDLVSLHIGAAGSPGSVGYTYSVGGRDTSASGVTDATIYVPRDTPVYLTAAPSGPDSAFQYWTGGATAAESTVSVIMDGDKSVAAHFGAPAQTVSLTIGVAPAGSGSVTYAYWPGDGITVTGAASSTKAVSVPRGLSVSLTADGSEGNSFQYWTESLHTASRTQSIAMDGDKTAIAHFGASDATVTLTLGIQIEYSYSTVDGASVSGATPSDRLVSVPKGTEVALTAVQSGSGKFQYWTGDLRTAENPSSVAMDRDKSVSAHFGSNANDTATLNLSITPSSTGGTVTYSYAHGGNSVAGSATAGKTIYAPLNATIALAAEPISPNVFVSWTGSVGSTDPSASLLMDGDKSVTAIFAPASGVYSLNIVVEPASLGIVEYSYLDGTHTVTGSVSASASIPVPLGRTVTLTAVPIGDNKFLYWSTYAVFPTNPITVMMDGAKIVTARFAAPSDVAELAISVYPASSSGSVTYDYNVGSMHVIGSMKSGTIFVPKDATVHLSASAGAGTSFQYWTGDLHVACSDSILMSGNKSVTAHFGASDDTVSLTLGVFVNAPGSVEYSYHSGEDHIYGAISSVGTAISVPRGETVSLTASPSGSSLFLHWVGDVTSTDPQESVEMTVTKSVSARFVALENVAMLRLAFSGPGSVTYSYYSYYDNTAVSGTASSDKEVLILKNATVTLSASPSGSGNSFLYWSGAVNTADNPTSVQMTGDKGITAHFGSASSVHAMNISVSGPGSGSVGYYYTDGTSDITGAISSSGTIIVPGGFTVYLSAYPSPGSSFLYWSGDHRSAESFAPIVMDRDMTVAAHFGPESSVRVLSIGILPEHTGSVHYEYVDGAFTVSGTVYEESNTVHVPSGTRVYLTAAGGGGGAFMRWSGSIVSANSSESILMDGDKSAIANFGTAESAYTLSIVTEPPTFGNVIFVYRIDSVEIRGTATGDLTQIAVPKGTVVVLQAMELDINNTFMHWTGAADTANNPLELKMNGDKEITAHFGRTIDSYDLTVGISPVHFGTVGYSYYLPDSTHITGTFTLSTDVISVPRGTTVSLHAEELDYNTFMHWTGEVNTANNPLSLVMDGNKSVTAHFGPIGGAATLLVAVSPDGSGSVSYSYLVGDTEISGTFSESPGRITATTGTPVVLRASSTVPGMAFTHWTGAADTANNPLSLVMDGIRVIRAHFEPVSGLATLNVRIDPEIAGSVSYSYEDADGTEIAGALSGAYGYIAVPIGTVVSVAASPLGQFAFQHWHGALSTAESSGSVAVTGDMDLTAYFGAAGKTFSLDIGVSPEGSGSVSYQYVDGNMTVSGIVSGSKSISVPVGATVHLTASPSGPNSFRHWSGALSTAEREASIIEMEESKAVTAVFGPASDTAVLTLGVRPASSGYATYSYFDGMTVTGTVSAGSAAVYVPVGTTVSLAASGGSLVFQHWAGDVHSAESQASIAMDGDRSATAVFGTVEQTAILELGVSPDSSGSVGYSYLAGGDLVYGAVSVSSKTISVPEGTPVSLTASSGSLVFLYWSGSISAADNPATIEATGTKSAIAHFGTVEQTAKLTIGVSPDASGYVSYSYEDGTETIEGTVAEASRDIYVPKGATVRLAASPAEGRAFRHWSGSIGAAEAEVSVTVGGDTEAFANFGALAQTVTLTLGVTGSPGSVEYSYSDAAGVAAGVASSAKDISVPKGATVTLTAVSGGSGSFQYWTGALTAAENPASILMDDDKEVAAHFGVPAQTVTLTLGVSGSPGSVTYSYIDVQATVSGTVSAASKAISVPKGATVTLTAIGGGYAFQHWTGAISTAESPATVLMDGDKAVTAVFGEADQTVILTLGVSGSPGSVTYTYIDGATVTGTVSSGSKAVSVPKGTAVSLVAIGEGSSAFLHWSGAISAAESHASILMDAGKSVTAHFGPSSSAHSVSLSVIGDGKIEYAYAYGSGDAAGTVYAGSPATISVPDGARLVLNPVALGAGVSFSYWSGDMPGNASPLVIDGVASSFSLAANFTAGAESPNRTLTLDISGPGAVYVSVGSAEFPYEGPVTVSDGTAVTLTAAAFQDATFIWWGEDLSGTDPVQALAMNGDVSASALFKSVADVVTVKVRVNGGGSGEVRYQQNGEWYGFPYDDGLTVPKNSELTLAAIKAQGSVFMGWTGALGGQVAVQTLVVGSTGPEATAWFELESATTTVTVTLGGTGTGSIQYSQNGWQTLPMEGDPLSGTLTVMKGEQVQLKAVPGGSTSFLRWEPAGGRPISGQDITWDAGQDPTYLTALFSSVSVINVKANVSGIGIVQYFMGGWHDFDSYGVNLSPGDDLEVRAVAGDGYMFVWWDDGIYGDENPYRMRGVANSMSIRAVFAPSSEGGPATVRATATGPGTVQYGLGDNHWVDFPSDGLAVPRGASLPVRAAPGQNSVFIWWTGDLSGTDPVQTLQVGDGAEVFALFAAMSGTVSVKAQVDGDGSVAYWQNGAWREFPSSDLTVPMDTDLRLLATPGAGSVFLWWTGALGGQDDVQTFNVGVESKTVKAWFMPEAGTTTVTVSIDGAGTGSVQYRQNNAWHTLAQMIDGASAPGTLTVPKGEQVQLKAVPGGSTSFLRWEPAGGRPISGQDITWDAGQDPTSLTALFSSVSVINVKADKIGYGTVQYRMGGVWHDFDSYGVNLSPGDDLEVRAVAGDGYTFVWWDDGIYGDENPYRMRNVVNDAEIRAVFAPSAEMVRAVADADGPGKVQYRLGDDAWVDFPAGGMDVPRYTDLPLRATPGQGSVFIWWTGALSGLAPDAVLSVGHDGAEARALFAPVSGSATVFASVSGEGGILFQQNGAWQGFPSNGRLTVPMGCQLPLMAVAGTDHVFLWWTGDLGGHVSDPILLVDDREKSVTAVFELESATTTLTVSLSGSGNGSVGYWQNDAWQTLAQMIDGDSASGTLTVPKGEPVRLAAKEGPSTSFLRWQGVAESAGSKEITQAIGQDPVSISALFSAASVINVKADKIGYGTVQYRMGGVWHDFGSEGVNLIPGDDLEVQALAADGSVFLWWDRGIYGHDSPYMMRNVVSHTEIRAVFSAEGDATTVTASAVGNGTVQYRIGEQWIEFPSGALAVPKDRDLPVMAVPTGGSSFVSWSGGGLSLTPAQQILAVGSSPVAISATFSSDAVYTLSLSATAGGYTEYHDGSGWVLFPSSGLPVRSGTMVQVRAVATTGLFSLWTGDLTFLEPDLDITVAGNISAQAKFVGSDSAKRLTASADGTGSGAVLLNNGGDWHAIPAAGVWLEQGYSAEVGAVPSSGVFVWWTGALSGTSDTGAVAMDGDKAATAWFYLADDFTEVEAAAEGSGSGKIRFFHGTWQDFPSSGVLKVPKGESLQLEAAPTSGEFVWWTGALSGFAAMQTLDVGDSRKEVFALFEPSSALAEVDASVTGDGSGKVLFQQNDAWQDFPATGVLKVPKGYRLPVMADAADGSVFLWWTQDLSGFDATQTLEVGDSDKEIIAEFELAADATTLAASTDGTGSGKVQFKQNGAWQDFPATGVLTVSKDSDLPVRAVPTGGSSFVSWSGGGLSPTPADQTIAIGSSPVSITATFSNGSDAYYTLSLSATAGGHIEYYDGSAWTASPSSGLPVRSGTMVQVRAVATTGLFSLWTGDLTFLEPDLEITVAGDISAQAKFVEATSAKRLTASADGTGSGIVQLKNGGDWHAIPAAGVWLEQGYSAEVRAVPSSGVFVWWTGALSGTSDTGAVAMDGDKSVTAWFEASSNVVTVTASTVGGGSGKVLFQQNGAWQDFPSSGVLKVPKGYRLPVWAVPTGGSSFVSWSGGGLSPTPADQTLFVGSSDVAIAATFSDGSGSDTYYTVSLTATAGGYIEYYDGSSWAQFPGAGLTVPSGAQVRIRAVPSDSSHVFSLWTGGLTFLEPDLEITVAGDISAQAKFVGSASAMKLTASTEGTGSGAVLLKSGDDWHAIPAGGVWLEQGSSADVRAAAEGGSAFIWWTGALYSFSAEEAVSMTEDRSVTARFETSSNAVTATVSADGSGKVQIRHGEWRDFPSSGVLTVPRGEPIEIRAVASAGAFSYWSGDASGYAPEAVLDMAQSRSAVAHFTGVAYSSLTVRVAEGSGTVTARVGGTDVALIDGVPLSVTKGSQVLLIPSASAGRFSYWSGDLTGNASPAAASMASNMEIDAHFTDGLNDRSLSVYVTGAGRVSVTVGSAEFGYSSVLWLSDGEAVGLAAYATGSAYSFAGWSGDRSGSAPTLSFAMDANVSVTALFVSLSSPEHTIYAYTDGHADVSPGTGSMVVQRGSSVTYAFTAREGWVLSAIIVDGSEIEMQIGAEAYSYTFWSVSSNHTIGVRCAERTEAPGGGDGNGGGDGSGDGDGDGGYGGGDGGEGQPSSSGAPSPVFAAAVFLALVTVLTAILWLFFAAAYNSIEVVIEAEGGDKISGKAKARRHKAYAFSVRDGYSAVYRVGDDAWKKPASIGEGRFEVPAEDVERKITIKAVTD